jgi:hypothetical protein
MKFEKKHWMMLVAGLVVLFLVYWFFFRKKKVAESSYNPAVPIWGIGMGEPSESNFRKSSSSLVNKEVPMCKYTYTYRNDAGEKVEGVRMAPCPGGATTAPKAMVSRVAGGGKGICYIKIEFPDGTTQLQEVPCPTIKDKLPSAI